jgi:hypothetical protein
MQPHLDGKVARRSRGAQPGNRLALKRGRYVQDMRALDAMVRQRRRAARAAIAMANAALAALARSISCPTASLLEDVSFCPTRFAT